MGRFVIKALTGPVKGKAFPVRHGLKIGRSVGDVLLPDRLVSDLHAEIKVYPNGKIMIIDKDSKNKIIIDDQKIVKSILEKGTKFKIGETEFELAFVKTPEEAVLDFINKHSKNIQNNPLSLKPFVRAIELVFTSGLQKGQRYYLSYGPRFLGSAFVDIPIFEKEAPKKAFAFVPDKTETFFMTDHPEIIKFNGQNIKKTTIDDGDTILVGTTNLQLNLKS